MDKKGIYYIKEAWATEPQYDHLKPREIPNNAKIYYSLDGYDDTIMGKKRSPLFMPQWAARHFIKITSNAPQRLQEITEEDAEAEGFNCWEFDNPDLYADCPCTNQFIQRWDSINPDYPFETNPFVFRYKFVLKEANNE